MTAKSRRFVLVLAVLLAATPAAADIVITADEVIHCWDVRPMGNDSVCFTLPRLELRTLSTFDIYEVRLAGSSRVTKLAAQLPQLRITVDSGQYVPPPAVRAEQLRQRVREASAENLLEYAVVVETLAMKASPAEMAARCREMKAALLECERSSQTVAGLLREVRREEAAVRGIWPQATNYLVSGPIAGLLVGLAGGAIGNAIYPEDPMVFCQPGGAIVGCPVGCIVGFVTGVAVSKWRRVSLVARHRDRVNVLVYRVNRAVATPP
jgi:hypothetical protein